MSESGPARPAPVTAAGWMVVLGGAFLVLTSFEQVSSLRSLESRRRVEEYLAGDGSGLGIGVDSALDVMHVLTIVTGCAAAAAAVLGFHVLRRNRAARIALSSVVVPLFVSGLVLGGLLTALVAVATVTLWLKPSRDWFDGKEPAPRQGPPPGTGWPWGRRDKDGPARSGGRAPDEPADDPADDQPADDRPADDRDHDEARREGPEQETGPLRVPTPGAGAPGEGGPRAYVGFGGPGAAPSGPQQPGPQQPGGPPALARQPAPHGHPVVRAPGRPGAVIVAATVTWTVTGLVGLLGLLFTVTIVAAPDLVIDQVARQDPEAAASLDRSTLVGATLAIGPLVVLWCVLGSVVAGFLVRGDAWARPALLVLAVVSGVVSIFVAALGSWVLVVAALASTVVMVSVSRPDVRRWSGR